MKIHIDSKNPKYIAKDDQNMHTLTCKVQKLRENTLKFASELSNLKL